MIRFTLRFIPILTLIFGVGIAVIDAVPVSHAAPIITAVLNPDRAGFISARTYVESIDIVHGISLRYRPAIPYTYNIILNPASPTQGMVFAQDRQTGQHSQWLYYFNALSHHLTTIYTLVSIPGETFNAGDYALAWSPDNQYVTFRNPTFNKLYLVELETGAQRLLLDDIGIWAEALWSPDGQQIWVKTSEKVMVINNDGENTATLKADSDYQQLSDSLLYNSGKAREDSLDLRYFIANREVWDLVRWPDIP